MAEFYRLREEGLSRLETLNQKLVEETHDYRMRLDAEMAEHRQALTASFDENNQVLEAKYEERTAAVELHERDLENLRRDLDDRSARHARREQGRALQKKISDRSEKFTLTSATQRKRLPVHMIFVFLLLLSGGLTARTLLFPAMATEGAALWLELGVQRQRVVSAIAHRFDRCVGVRCGTETCSIALKDFGRIRLGRRVC